MKKNIVLTGFMGVGKSIVAQKLAQVLAMQCVALDARIEKREAKPITQIFTENGEDYFRDVESAVVKEIAAKTGQVIDCGGGVVVRQENIDALRTNGIIFYLHAMPEVIYQRIKSHTHRPLLNVDNPQAKIAELLSEREPLYRKADHIIDTSTLTIDQVVAKITGELSND